MGRRVLVLLLALLVLGGAESRRGRGDRGGEGRGGEGRGRRARARQVAKRQVGASGGSAAASDCKEYTENGEKYLDCQDRGLTSIPQGWPTDIHHLLLARNKLQVLRAGTLSHLKQLRSLDLQQNTIARIDDDAFEGLPHLTTLLLQHNRLRSLSEEVLISLPSLRYLRLYANPWQCDCQLDGLVRTLQVPSNRQLGNFAKCDEPQSIRGHKLKKLKADLLCEPPPPDTGSVVTYPPATGGGGTGGGGTGTGGGVVPRPPNIFKPQDATSLCHTYIYPTPLLTCNGRDLKYVPADIPPDIVKMDLSANGIQRLKPHDFLTAKDLKALNLSSNSLESIAPSAFAGLLYLRELDLSNNSLQYFQYGVLEDLYFLKRLHLEGNPWRCDYSIHYLIYWLRHHPGVSHSGLRCSEPAEFAGWLVEDYVKTYNADCPKDKGYGGGGGLTNQGQGRGDNGVGDTNQDTAAQELRAETEEAEGGAGLLPSPLRMPGRKPAFEIIRLS